MSNDLIIFSRKRAIKSGLRPRFGDSKSGLCSAAAAWLTLHSDRQSKQIEF
jgi:hypothetical protein